MRLIDADALKEHEEVVNFGPDDILDHDESVMRSVLEQVNALGGLGRRP